MQIGIAKVGAEELYVDLRLCTPADHLQSFLTFADDVKDALDGVVNPGQNWSLWGGRPSIDHGPPEVDDDAALKGAVRLGLQNQSQFTHGALREELVRVRMWNDSPEIEPYHTFDLDICVFRVLVHGCIIGIAVL